MRAPWRRAAALSLAVCGFSSLSLTSGCKSDLEKADAQVAADVEHATDKLQSSMEPDIREAGDTLSKTVQVKGSSPVWQIESHSLLAQADADAADKLIGQIVDRDAEIAALLAQMDAVGAQLAINNLNVAGYRKLEPTLGLDAVKKETSNAQVGAREGAWVPGQPPVPSLADAKKREADLQTQIQDLTTQRDELNEKRAKALQQADQLSRESDAAKGKDSVGFFTQASAQRKEAADEGAKIDLIEGQLALLQQDMAIAQLQRKTIEDAVAGFEQQAQSLQKGWADVQKQIENTTALSQSLLAGEGGAPAAGGAATQPAQPTLAALVAQLDEAVKQVQELRSKATTLLDDASTQYDAAANAATNLDKDLGTKARSPESRKLPEKRAWDSLLQNNQQQSFKLQKARVEGRLARLYAGEYAELRQRNKLAEMLAMVLKQAGVPTPPPLSAIAAFSGQIPPDIATQLGAIEQEVEKKDFSDYQGEQAKLDQLAQNQSSPVARQAIAATRATLAYAWADWLLSDVIDNPGQSDLATLAANQAHSARMIDQYGWMQLALMRGDKQHADGHLAVAKAERDAALQNKAVLPTVLPPGLELPIATQPTTEPTTNPSGEGATTNPSETPTTAAAPETTAPGTGAETQPAAPATAPAGSSAGTPSDTAAPTQGAVQPGAQQAPPPPQETPAQRRRRGAMGR